jgi:hypothetical protein
MKVLLFKPSLKTKIVGKEAPIVAIYTQSEGPEKAIRGGVNESQSKFLTEI